MFAKLFDNWNPALKIEQAWPAERNLPIHEIDAAWDRALASGAKLYNGALAIYLGCDEHFIYASVSDYKTWNYFRKNRDGDTPAHTALAISSVIVRDGNFLIGRRSNGVLLEPGFWEFAGSGSFEPTASGRDVIYDQFRREIQEELSISANEIKSIKLIGVFIDPILKVADIVGLVEISTVATPNILTASSDEYDLLAWLNSSEIEKLEPLSQLAREIIKTGTLG